MWHENRASERGRWSVVEKRKRAEGKKESVKQRRGVGRFANDFTENFDLAVVMKTANFGDT